MEFKFKKAFASDNYSGVHPEVMDALMKANTGHAPGYGADQYTARATDLFREHFGESCEVFFVYNGTGANVLGLKASTQSFNAIFCSELAHINVDESTAPETFTGCKVVPIRQKNGKIHPSDIEQKIIRVGDQHHPQARVISVSQTTEYGTVYSIDEIRELAGIAHRHNMLLHMDGSRISNAAVSLGKEFREFTFDAGVDILSFGGTKNGLMFGEAVIFAKAETAAYFSFIRKQGMQLHSKMRFIGAQFCALLENELWRRNAQNSNSMAQRMYSELARLPKITITQPVDANAIFAIMPVDIIATMQEQNFFYIWNESLSEVRLMCSFDTTTEEVDLFVEKIKEELAEM